MTASPITVESIRVVLPRVPSITMPLWTPTPEATGKAGGPWRSWFHSASRRCIPMAALTAASACPDPSWSNRAMIASPMNLSMKPPKWSIGACIWARYSLRKANSACGVRSSEIVVKDLMSLNSVVIRLAWTLPGLRFSSPSRAMRCRNCFGTNFSKARVIIATACVSASSIRAVFSSALALRWLASACSRLRVSARLSSSARLARTRALTRASISPASNGFAR